MPRFAMPRFAVSRLVVPTFAVPHPALLRLAPLAALLALGCPAKAPTPEDQQQAANGAPPGVPVVSEDQPGVVRDGDELYPIESAPNLPPEPAAPGSGLPDTSNGVCRLFAPKLPEPACCPTETGFDAELFQAACGLELYLGESLQHSCGYYFLPRVEGSSPRAVRLSQLRATSVEEAAKAHDERIRYRLKQPEFASTPVPGLPEARWSNLNGIYWAFLPGWEMVRLVSWEADLCSEEAMPAALKAIAGAEPPPPGAARQGLVPRARGRG